MDIRTKIICTIGPSVNSIEKMLALTNAGMDVARINFSHGTYEEHAAVIHNLKEVRKKIDKPLAIMMDTKGPEVRLGKFKQDQLLLEMGALWRLTADEVLGDEHVVTIRPGSVLNQLKLGSKVLFDDGYISSHVVEIKENGIVVAIENSGVIKGGRGVNFPYSKLDLPTMTEKDIEDIKFGCEHDVDYIAVSFVRSADDVLAIKQLVAELGKPEILITAKIETHEAVQNFDRILQYSDGIMIARGDLGVEVPLTQVPKLQKMMVRKSYLAGKPSITATQMLESMIYNPRPTRAEASDVANAIYDSSSVVMLSGETAVGKYPIETVLMMKNIAREAEEDFNYREFFNYHTPLAYHDVPSAVTLATVKTAYSSNAKAIFAFTTSGSTARLLARLRPQMPIIAMTSNEKSYHQMALNWGVFPVLGEECSNIVEAFSKLSTYALEKRIVKFGDIVVVTAGSPFGRSGTTNTMIVESIGNVLIRGASGHGERIHGKISLVHSTERTSPTLVKDRIIVIAKCDKSYLPLMKVCKGIILQNHCDDLESETYVMQMARDLLKPAIVRANGAFDVLYEGQLITLDPKDSLVYKEVLGS